MDRKSPAGAPTDVMRNPAIRIAILVGVWLLAMTAGFWLDGPVARWAHRAAIDKDHPGNHVMKMAGDWRFTLAVAVALIAWHPQSWRAAGLLALSAATGGVVYSLLKWLAGRRRPVVIIDPFAFTPFRNGWSGLFGEPNLSFPSGHTCLAFATAMSMAICLPRWKYAFFAIAAVVGFERVAENAHYLSDVIAGAGVGIFSAYLAYWGSNWILMRRSKVAGAEDAAQPAAPAQPDARPESQQPARPAALAGVGGAAEP